jgi:hypothetical protein
LVTWQWKAKAPVSLCSPQIPHDMTWELLYTDRHVEANTCIFAAFSWERVTKVISVNIVFRTPPSWKRTHSEAGPAESSHPSATPRVSSLFQLVLIPPLWQRPTPIRYLNLYFSIAIFRNVYAHPNLGHVTARRKSHAGRVMQIIGVFLQWLPVWILLSLVASDIWTSRSLGNSPQSPLTLVLLLKSASAAFYFTRSYSGLWHHEVSFQRNILPSSSTSRTLILTYQTSRCHPEDHIMNHHRRVKTSSRKYRLSNSML